MSVDEAPSGERQDGFVLPTVTDAGIDDAAASLQRGQEEAARVLGQQTAFLADLLDQRLDRVETLRTLARKYVTDLAVDDDQIIVDLDHVHLIRDSGNAEPIATRALSIFGFLVMADQDPRGAIFDTNRLVVRDGQLGAERISSVSDFRTVPLSNQPFGTRQTLKWDELHCDQELPQPGSVLTAREPSPAFSQRLEDLVHQLNAMSGVTDEKQSGRIVLTPAKGRDDFGLVAVNASVRVGESRGHVLVGLELPVRVADPEAAADDKVLEKRFGYMITKDFAATRHIDLRHGSRDMGFNLTVAVLHRRVHEATQPLLAKMIRETHQRVTALD